MNNFNIKYIYEAIDKFSPVAQKIGENVKKQADAFKKLAKDIKKAKDRYKELNETVKKIGTGMLVAGAVMAAALLVPINNAAELEAKLSSLKAVTASTVIEMKAYKSMARSVADLGFNATEATGAIEELAKAGVSAKAIMNGGLRGALYLAVAGEINVADAAEIASTALNAFKRDNLTVVQAADILAGAANASATDISRLKLGLSQCAAVSSAAGLSFKDTANTLAVFSQNGLQGSDAGTSLKTMLMNLQPRSDEQVATFIQLGLATGKLVKVTKDGTPKFKLMSNLFYDSKGKMKNMAQIAELLKSKMKHLTDQQRGFALETMFGSDAIRAGNILYKEGAKGINDMAAAMSKTKIADVAIQKIDNFQGGMKIFGALMYNIGASLGEAFLPALKLILKGLNFLAKKFDSLPQGVKSFIAISAALTAGLLILGGVIGTVLIPAFTNMLALFGAGGVLTTAFASGGALAGLIPIFTAIGAAFAAVFTPMGILITAVLIPVIAALSGMFVGLWSGFMAGIAPAMPAISSLAGFLKNVLGGVLTWLLGLLKPIFDYSAKIGTSMGKTLGWLAGGWATGGLNWLNNLSNMNGGNNGLATMNYKNNYNHNFYHEITVKDEKTGKTVKRLQLNQPNVGSNMKN